MRNHIKQINYKEYDSENELTEQDKTLLDKAHDALGRAYAPYSRYRVGAALLLANGEIFTGNNQENVAYPSGLCAERVAAFAASSQYPDEPFEAIAITAQAQDFDIDSPVTPCGSCRQVLAEYEKRHQHSIRLILQGEKGKIQVIDKVEDMLPLMFHADELKKK
ncbi:MAG: cytidine deaminase [Bacteroidales bacterium]|nr:cytidine deaminase [Bacteroidales bacterium]